jgi:hypothetical protein
MYSKWRASRDCEASDAGCCILFYTGLYRIEDTEERNKGLACVLTGFGVYGIIYRPVSEWIRLFRFVATDILAVLIRLGWVWMGTGILAGLGLGLDGMMIFVLGAHACARACTRARAYARACAELRVYTSTVPS